jgi:hypothetical protein
MLRGERVPGSTAPLDVGDRQSCSAVQRGARYGEQAQVPGSMGLNWFSCGSLGLSWSRVCPREQSLSSVDENAHYGA